MEAMIIHFIQQHIDLLKYGGLFLGIVYSYYRRIITDRRDNQLNDQRVGYVKQLTDRVVELQHQEDLQHENHLTTDTERQALRDTNEELRNTIKELHETIEDIRKHACINCPGGVEKQSLSTVDKKGLQ